MILFFSGTGNSAYAAKYISEKINDEVKNLFNIIREKDTSPLKSEKPWVIVAPTYSWQLPLFLRDWLKNAKLEGSKDVYFVLTCGGEIGDAPKHLIKLCKKMNVNYKGCAEVKMPENYIAMFDSCDEDKAKRIIEKCIPSLDEAANAILEGESIPENKCGFVGKLYSTAVNPLFYSIFVKDKKFYATDECINCGLCEKKCILGNIEIKDGKPSWKGNCTHCMACISYCPKNAIEYGKASQGKRRYVCPF